MMYRTPMGFTNSGQDVANIAHTLVPHTLVTDPVHSMARLLLHTPFSQYHLDPASTSLLAGCGTASWSTKCRQPGEQSVIKKPATVQGHGTVRGPL